ncbi:MgtC/SapB family protein [Futiania mangrovi]|uniref:DUF4010 domain-containing protein n=1 Tax=Futiania mangrovi TaxID=2959716 RepID=A0A9J6PF28_9PROT|nr:DUF4010 domain-containing protein [Futiania mangrovii]MCP1335223.1 DUF4010 domain-containing protein [Futiania mangrovii]
MDVIQIFERLGLALAIGLLIGIERGWQSRSEASGDRTAGLRTFALIGLLGGALGAAARWSDMMLAAAGFLAVTAVVAVYRYRETAREGTFGVTTVVAAMLTYGLGVYAAVGNMQAAAAAGVMAAGLLAMKQSLHGFLSRVTWPELRAALLLAAMSLILLPILPDRGMGPYGAINPREVWLLTILIALVSSAGYVAVRVAGTRAGVPLGGLAGGLVSSTAASLSFARMGREAGGPAPLFAGAVVLSGGVMFVRLWIVVSLVRADLAPVLAAPLIAATLVSVGIGAFMVHAHREAEVGALDLKSPFELGFALKFGGLLALVSLLARAAEAEIGAAGLYVLALVSGLADVDAVSLSAARSTELDAHEVGLAILIAAVANTVAKAVLVRGAGTPEIFWRVAGAWALALAAGTGAYAAAWGLAV